MRTIAVILSGPGGELDRVEFTVYETDAEEFIDLKVSEALEDWTYSVGDTIEIREVLP
jgi:hypothetical protein